jgi:apolipoprotein D and lipocalin family protein
MNKIFKLLIIMGIFSFFGCNNTKELATVAQVDLKKYSGKWYEIARLPNSFEKGLECISAFYSINPDGTIKVVNKGYLTEDNTKAKQSEGIAKLPDSQFPGQLKVSFFRPFWGQYYIFYLDENYQYALVGTPSRKYFWILAREKTLPNDTLNNLIKIAKDEGFDTDILIYPKQVCP